MKKERVAIIDALILFIFTRWYNMLIVYLSAIERLICRREISLIGSTSFVFAQNTMHYFDKCHKNKTT